MFSKMSAKLESAESDLGKAAKALEEVNEANLLLESLLTAELKKNSSLEAQIEGYKVELMIAYKAVTELKKKERGGGGGTGSANTGSLASSNSHPRAEAKLRE
jgi:hypothetical protein